MRVLGIDLETTGLDTGNDRITELGVVVWDVEGKKPLEMANFLIHPSDLGDRLTPEAVEMMGRVCGLTPAILEEFGVGLHTALGTLHDWATQYKIGYAVAHNAENFDRPLLEMELKRQNFTPLNTPWIDTRTDLPFEVEPSSRKLNHLAADHGFINPFAHRAVFDVLTMLRVMSHYDFARILEYRAIPFVTVRALVDYADREKAKARRYAWQNLGDKTYPKCWVKRIKQNKLEEEQAQAGFPVVVLSDTDGIPRTS